MKPDLSSVRLLRKLVENEEALADLYRSYAGLFPSFSDFWLQMAEEEVGHAGTIQALYADRDVDAIRTDRFGWEVLEVSMNYIVEQKARVKNGNITSHEAFDIALGLETGMLERGYFEVFQGGSVEFIRRLQRLKAETQAHTDKIRSQIDRKHWL